MPVQTATTTQLLSDRYVLGPVLGLGGMAEVRDGWDTQTGRLVAIKRLRSELAHDEELVSRFETERRVVARLRHPNLVEALNQGEFLGVPYLVLERLAGETLRDRLDDGPLAPDAARAMALQLLAALEAVHLAGVLHLDVKPRNVFMTQAGTWKLGDFGAGVDRSTRSPIGFEKLLGTPDYVAPEVLNGSAPTPAADLFGFGVVLYEALSGSRPVVDGRHPPVPLDGYCAAPVGPLADVAARCVRVDPVRRYASAAAAREAILRPAGDATERIRVLDDTRVMPTTLLAELPSRSPRGSRQRRRNSIWIGTTIALAVLGLGSLGVALAGGPTSHPGGGHRAVGTRTVGGSTRPAPFAPGPGATPATVTQPRGHGQHAGENGQGNGGDGGSGRHRSEGDGNQGGQ